MDNVKLNRLRSFGLLPKEISGALAVREVMGFDGLAALQQQLTRAMTELARVAKQQTGEKR